LYCHFLYTSESLGPVDIGTNFGGWHRFE